MNGLIRCEEDLGPVDVFQFRNRQNLVLQGYSWLVKDHPQAIIVFIHGVTSHARFEFLNHNYDQGNGESAAVGRQQEDSQEKPPAYPRYLSYKGSLVERMNKNNVSFCTYDQQGHGASEAWKECKCNVETFEDFAFDALQFLVLVNRLYNPDNHLPIFIAGISMGGGVTLRTLQLYKTILAEEDIPDDFGAAGESVRCGRDRYRRRRSSSRHRRRYTSNGQRDPLSVTDCLLLPLKGGIVFCPNLSLKSVQEKLGNRVLLPLSGVASAAAPNAKVASIAPNTMFPWIEADRRQDVHGIYNDKLPARIADENLRVGPAVRAAMQTLADSTGDKPISLLLIHSRLDTMCDPSGSEELYAGLKENMADVSLWLLDAMWHYLLIEPGTEDLQERVIDWLKARLMQ